MSAVTGSPTQAWKVGHFILLFGVALVLLLTSSALRCCNKYKLAEHDLEHSSAHLRVLLGSSIFCDLSSSSGHHSRSRCPSFRCSLESLCNRRGLWSQPANQTNKYLSSCKLDPSTDPKLFLSIQAWSYLWWRLNHSFVKPMEIIYTLNSVNSRLWQPKVHMMLRSSVVLTWMHDIRINTKSTMQ